MNPDYYKTKEKKLYKHEFDRVTSMKDSALDVRYGKMTKHDKIAAFYEALVDEQRAPLLREKIAENLGYNDSNTTKETPTVDFVKVLKNEDETKQAIFLQPESGQHYLYSYVNNEHAHETMVFQCDATGDSSMSDIVSCSGYEHSDVMMERLMRAVDKYDEL